MKYVSFLITLCVLSCTSKTQENELSRHVGDIVFDPKIDTTSFEPCRQDLARQYYNFSNAIRYHGEKAKIIREFKSRFRPVDENENGYVTIRFIVNCEGMTGWFRMTTMDDNYKLKKMSSTTTNQLLKITMELDGWELGESDGEIYDYYQYLTFKITKGHIENILP